MRKLFVLSAILTSACVVKPGVDNASLSSTTFSHKNFMTACASCHEKNRPAPVSGVAHGSGRDCVSCHSPSRGWIPTTGMHNPPPTSCATCHESRRPATTASGQPHVATGDCISCHTTAGWKPAVVPHTPTPTSCVACHESQRPTTLPSGATHVATGDCVSCHTTGAWKPAADPHTPTTTSCVSCHESNRPARAQHPSVNDPAVTDKRHYVAKDCAVCHTKPVDAWYLWNYSPGTQRKFEHIGVNGQVVGFCLPCHYTQGMRKHGAGGAANFNGDGNCRNCHDRSLPRNPSWDH